MYFFVPYNISEIQKGIQAGHAAQQFDLKYSSTRELYQFISKDKTWIILNGGTTNNSSDVMIKGSMQKILDSITIFNLNNPHDIIDFETFYEPDLNDALTAICFLCDERVYDTNFYPNFIMTPYLVEGEFNSVLYEEGVQKYKEWVESVGGDKIAFLKDLIKDKKLA
jgi:hypothetical protein